MRAGAAWEGGALAPGEAVEISTGAPVPSGAWAVQPLEHAFRSTARVGGPVPAEGKHMRRAGEDAPAGACLASPGTRIGPALIGLAAACGYELFRYGPAPASVSRSPATNSSIPAAPGPAGYATHWVHCCPR